METTTARVRATPDGRLVLVLDCGDGFPYVGEVSPESPFIENGKWSPPAPDSPPAPNPGSAG
jgi:hypothetical protein